MNDKPYKLIHMNNNKLGVFKILSTTKEFLVRSKEKGFTNESPENLIIIIDGMLNCLFDEKLKIYEYWDCLYGPTGPLQETAIANGWHDAFIELATDFDVFGQVFKSFTRNLKI